MVLLTGFLGAGKTTVLNHLLRAASAPRIGVLVNDFGSVGIDAMLVAGQVDAMVSLPNGCLCCMTDEIGFDAMLGRLAASGGLDAIVVEASGLAEPANLASLVRHAGDPRIRYGGLISVVDAAGFEHARREAPELVAQLPLADLVVVNKADLVNADALEALVAQLVSLAPHAPVLTTTEGAVAPELLFDAADTDRDDARQLGLDELLRELEHDHHDHAHTRFRTVTLRSSAPLHPRRLVEFLEHPGDGVYRVKGFAGLADVTGDGAAMTVQVQVVGRSIRLQRSADAATELVVIGPELRAADLEQHFAGLRAEPGEVDETGLLPVARYRVDLPRDERREPVVDELVAPPD